MTPARRFALNYIVEAADDIAYCIADLEDGVDKGILSLKELAQLLEEEWHQSCEGEYLPELCQRLLHHAPSESDFFQRFRERLWEDLCQQSAVLYLKHHPAVFAGDYNQPLLSAPCGPAQVLGVCKRVAQQHLFCHREVETLELRGYTAMKGLLEIYRPLLELSAEEFSQLLNQPGCGSPFLVERLFHRLPARYLACYRRAIASSCCGFLCTREQEWYYRVRLVIDFISGMTDPFVLDEYQQLAAI
ncbi:hypothetical protein [Dongshaea marina]|uniref:hypothetical protein n=1 Tax=Dongshaea marina TaxID=2047966 RepID=UPI001F26A2A2|nr:hypothetical protein [Dongshaea marina]